MDNILAWLAVRLVGWVDLTVILGLASRQVALSLAILVSQNKVFPLPDVYMSNICCWILFWREKFNWKQDSEMVRTLGQIRPDFTLFCLFFIMDLRRVK